jgi:hypothetical protein
MKVIHLIFKYLNKFSHHYCETENLLNITEEAGLVPASSVTVILD